MGQKDSQTVTQTNEPWGPIQGQLETAADWNKQGYLSGMFNPSPLGGQFSDEALKSMQMTSQRASQGAPLIGAAQGYLARMMQPGQTMGMFKDPYAQMQGFTKTISNDVLDDVIPAAVSQFAGAGMPNSTLAMDTVGDAASTAVTNAVAPYYSAALDRTASMQDAAMNRGMQAAGMVPGMETAGYLPAQMMGQVGSQIDAMDEALARSQADAFQRYLGNLTTLGGMGGTTSMTEPTASPLQRIGAGGLTGLGSYGMLAANPATAPFALAGGIGAGLFGML